MEQGEKFAGWCIVEVLGHKTFAGYVLEQEVAGAQFVRIDVPETAAGPAFTRLVGPGSIYSITPVSEEVARLAAARLRAEAVTVWIPELHPPPPVRIAPALRSGEDCDDSEAGDPGKDWDHIGDGPW